MMSEERMNVMDSLELPNLLQPSDSEIDASQKRLNSYAWSDKFFRLDQFQVIEGKTFTEETDYRGLNMRRSYYSDCRFDGAKLSHSGLVGSVFRNCTFVNCDMDYCIADTSVFSKCAFTSDSAEKTIGQSFCKCIFYDCQFEDMSLDSTAFTDSIFEGVTITNCVLDNIIWENAIFRNTSFIRTELNYLNFEFTQFYDVHFEKTDIPYESIPFIFGGIEYMSNTQDDVHVSVTINGKTESIDKSEYLELVPDLIRFYSGTINPFPLANILHALGKYDDVIKVLSNGLEKMLVFRDFRILKYYSILLGNDHYTEKQKVEFYRLIQSKLSKIPPNVIEARSVFLYMAEVRNNLLSCNNLPGVEIELSTNICFKDAEKIGKLITIIENEVEKIGVHSHHIEVRHNSPLTVTILAHALINALAKLINNLQYVLPIIQASGPFVAAAATIVAAYVSKRKTTDGQDISSSDRSDNQMVFDNCNISMTVNVISNGNEEILNQIMSASDQSLDKA